MAVTADSVTTIQTRNETVIDNSTSYDNIIFCIMGSVGFCGNILVVFIFLRSKIQRRRITNMLIMNQSTIDMIVSLFVIFNHVFDDYGLITEPGVVAELYCKLWLSQYTLWGTMIVSTFNLMALTFERYFAVIHPLTYKLKFTRRKASVAIVLVWVCGLSYSSFNIWTTYLDDITCNPWAGYPSVLLQSVFGVIDVCIGVFIPIGILIGCYTRIAIEIHRQSKMVGTSSHHGIKMTKAKTNVIRTLLLVAICFFFCWIFNGTYFLLYNIGLPLSFDSVIYKFGVMASFTNCCINPFIYVFSYNSFRAAMKEAFGCSTISREPYNGSSSILSQRISSNNSVSTDTFNLSQIIDKLSIKSDHYNVQGVDLKQASETGTKISNVELTVVNFI